MHKCIYIVHLAGQTYAGDAGICCLNIYKKICTYALPIIANKGFPWTDATKITRINNRPGYFYILAWESEIMNQNEVKWHTIDGTMISCNLE